MDTQPPTPGSMDRFGYGHLESSRSNLTPGSLINPEGAQRSMPGSLERSRSNLTPGSIPIRHPPTSLYIGSRGSEMGSRDDQSEADYGADLSHLSEIQEQITRVQQTEVFKQQRAAEQQMYTTITSSSITTRQGSSKISEKSFLAAPKQQIQPPTSDSSVKKPKDKNSSDKISLGKSSVGKQSSSSEASSELQAGAAKKKDKKSSLSSLFSVFSRKKSSN